MEKRMCELYDRECIDCGECEFCDLDPTKICNNCGKCLEIKDCASIRIDELDGVSLRERNKKKSFVLNGNFSNVKKIKK